MVQVLPPVPTFGSRLANVLSEAGGHIGEGLRKRSLNQQLQQYFPAAKNPPPPSDPNMPNQGGQLASQPAQGGIDINNISPTQALAIAPLIEEVYGKGSSDIFFKQLGTQQKIQAKKQSQENALLAPGLQNYYKGVERDRERESATDLALKAQQDAILSGDVDPWSRGHIANLARDFGVPEALLKPLETPGSKEFKTAQKTFLSGALNDTFKGTTTNREISLAEGLLTETGVTREGNLAALWLLQSNQAVKKEKIRLTDQLLEQGVPPSKVPSVVNKQIKSFEKQISDEYFDAINSLRKKK
jgi:hypothetical protein